MMLFKDEQIMWFPEKENLIGRLANKSEREIDLEMRDSEVIILRLRDKPKAPAIGRILMPVIMIFFLILMFIKWVITGEKYLDSWCKKFKFLDSLSEFAGLKD
tara:strand:+ start:121 stop:429 length:309 start_codon:yes stop_codon:yes gene_type:complete